MVVEIPVTNSESIAIDAVIIILDHLIDNSKDEIQKGDYKITKAIIKQIKDKIIQERRGGRRRS